MPETKKEDELPTWVLQERRDAYLARQKQAKFLRKAVWVVGIPVALVIFFEATGNNTYHVLGALGFGAFMLVLMWAVIVSFFQTVFPSSGGKK